MHVLAIKENVGKQNGLDDYSTNEVEIVSTAISVVSIIGAEQGFRTLNGVKVVSGIVASQMTTQTPGEGKEVNFIAARRVVVLLLSHGMAEMVVDAVIMRTQWRFISNDTMK